MNDESPICLQWKDGKIGKWRTFGVSGIPVCRPAKIRIDFNTAEMEGEGAGLIQEISNLVHRLHGEVTEEELLADLIPADRDDYLLEVLVCDGRSPQASLEPRVVEALKGGPRVWVLPLMPDGGSPSTLHGDLQKQNIAFWKDSIAELALTVLARAGVTSLDRRVFISYRRIETEPMASQLFEALTRLNFSVFLDTVSIDPGVDFQARLFEQLADKSMVLLLHSRTFSQSRWTIAEADYSREHDLGLLMLRLPDVDPNDPLIKRSRAGDVVIVDWKHLLGSSQESKKCPPFRLTDSALEEVVNQVVEQHDVEMIARLASLRKRTLDALDRNGVKHRPSRFSASVFAESSSPSSPKTYSLFPTSRPPGLSELYDASTRDRDVGDRRIVVGRIASFNPERVQQMDWTVGGRNVAYADASMLDVVAQDIRAGAL
jgi:hypothetical protein